MLPLTIKDDKTIVVLCRQAMAIQNSALQQSVIVQGAHHTFVPEK